MVTFKQLVLLVLDGFGIASASAGNAITEANPRNFNYLVNHFPATTLQASGPSVGLPWGERGNSEVGHLNLGSGQIVSQDLLRISNAIVSGEFFKNPRFLAACDHVKKNQSKLHLLGLVSDGSIHSSEEHLYALLAMAAEQKVKNVLVHMFTDGRDTASKVALSSLDRLSRKFFETGLGKIASITGRFYAMDRGKHWEVTELAYKALVLGEGQTAISAAAAIEAYYDQELTDEIIPPTVILEKGDPIGQIQDKDAVIFFNFRPDRMRQLVEALTDPGFNKFSRSSPFLQNVYYTSMTLYDPNLGIPVAFPSLKIKNSLSETLSLHNLRQFHIAESEKYAHVTSFFNGGQEAPFPLEEREIVTSPAAYQKRYEDVPEMSVDRVGARVVEKLNTETQFILVNFANPDMVGHTGNREAGIKAITAVDRNIGVIFEAVMAAQACLVITADHGNIEQIIDIRTGSINKEHSLNPVPFILAGRGLVRKKILSRGYRELPSLAPEGVLSDVAPTILELFGIPKPLEITGVSLLPLLLKQT